MTAITFSTHKFIRKLETAGFETRQAEAMTEALSEVLDESTTMTLASKSDMIDLRMELKKDINSLHLDLRDTKVDLIKWVTGALIAQAAVVATLVKLL